MADAHTKYRHTDISNRQVAELIGLARGITADGVIDDTEIDLLRRWLVSTEATNENTVLTVLAERVEEIVADGVVTEEERSDLGTILNALCRNDFEVGELLKPTSLPLCEPAPYVSFPGERFTFTGTFTHGKRKACEAAVISRGGSAGSLTNATTFLVIGDYVTDSWANETFGRKIEDAVARRARGQAISIVSERHWGSHLY